MPSPSPGCSGAGGPSPRRPRPRSPHPAPKLGLGGRRPRPPAGGIVYHPQQKLPTPLRAGGRRGEWAHPCGPRGPADAQLWPSSQPQPSTAPRTPFRPRREGPRTPALCPGPSSPLARSGSEGSARAPGSKPAPALGQTFRLALVATTWEPRAPAGARSGSGPRADTYRLPGRVRARAPGVGGSFPKAHRGEAGRVA